MKKTLLLMLAFVTCFAGAKADELTVADGTDTNVYLPIYGSYFDTEGTLGQVIYPASDLADMAGTEISKVQFYSKTTFPAKLAGCVLQISLKEVEEEIFEYPEGTYSYQPISDMTICGTYTVVGGETGLTFELETPFAYSGDKNLAIEVKVITKSSWNSIDFYGVNQETNHHTGLSVYSSQKRVQDFLPKATFEYTGEVLEYAAKVTPTELDFGKVLVDASATLNVTVQNKGANAFTPTLSGLAAPFSTTWTSAEIAAGETAEIPVTFEPTADGAFTGTLTITCGEAGSFEVALAGIAKIPGSEIIVCDGTNTSSYVPVYGMYYDTNGCQVQFIYPAEMLTELVGRQITSVKFYPESTVKINGGQLQLSVKETEQSVFERETAIAKPNEVTEMTAVATIVPVGTDTELVFEFNEPFTYTGGNLAFETLVLAKSSYVSGLKFYGENQSTDCAFYYGNSSSNGLAQFLPKAYFESTAAPVPETEFFINFTAQQDNGTIEVTLADGTPVVSQETKVPAGEPVTVKATANDGYVITTFEVTAGGEPLELDIENGANGAPLRATGPKQETHTFVMPEKEVAINVTFEVKTAINDINANSVKSVRYVNMQGIESATPFDGINIVVTEMNDGSKAITKEVK
ncbi:MAG: choice-of-anchor D domain-containing protein [Muribaculaceae bacterium]|nr:choice-of-anchor D domain-containing protein [Muribaculaceae bacterium]